MPTTVAQLPDELLQLIFQDATGESLRNCRLVDRRWSAASTPYLFARVHASLFSGPLAKLTTVSLSPLAKHVKAIDFHSDQLPYWHRSKWEEHLDYRPDYTAWRAGLGEHIKYSEVQRMYNELPRHDFTPAQLEVGWRVWMSHGVEMFEWEDGKNGLELRDCLSRFHNLKEVVIDRAKPFERRDRDKLYWKHFLKSALMKRDAWMLEKGTEQHPAHVASILMMIAVGHRNSIPGNKPVEKLLLDLPDDDPFRDMVYHSSNYPYERLMCGLSEQKNPSETCEGIAGAFRQLKHVTLQFKSAHEFNRPRIKAQIQEFTDFLTATRNLESLSLDFGEPDRFYLDASQEDNHSDHGIVSLMSRSTSTFQNLKELRVSGSFPSNPFITFLTMHQRTLKVLVIRDSLSDNWYRVFEYIGRFLKPEHVYVESLWQPVSGADTSADPELLLPEGLDDDNDFARDVKRYLYTGSGPVPVSHEYGMSDDYDSEMEANIMADPDEWNPEVDYSGFASGDADNVEDYSGGRAWYHDETMEERFARKEVERAERWARWRAADEARLAGRAD